MDRSHSIPHAKSPGTTAPARRIGHILTTAAHHSTTTAGTNYTTPAGCCFGILAAHKLQPISSQLRQYPPPAASRRSSLRSKWRTWASCTAQITHNHDDHTAPIVLAFAARFAL